MALTERIYQGDHLQLTCPSGTLSGALVVVGGFIGIAEINADAVTNIATVDIGGGVYALSVFAYNGTANTAINQGDPIYYNSGDTPKVNVHTAGVKIGYALDALASGSTAVIRVRMVNV